MKGTTFLLKAALLLGSLSNLSEALSTDDCFDQCSKAYPSVTEPEICEPFKHKLPRPGLANACVHGHKEGHETACYRICNAEDFQESYWASRVCASEKDHGKKLHQACMIGARTGILLAKAHVDDDEITTSQSRSRPVQSQTHPTPTLREMDQDIEVIDDTMELEDARKAAQTAYEDEAGRGEF